MEIIERAMHCEVQWNPTSKDGYFSVRNRPGEKLRGVHPVMETLLPYDAKELAKRNPKPAHSRSTKKGTSDAVIGWVRDGQRDSRGCYTGINSEKHGTIVDEQISAYAVTRGDKRIAFENREDLDACTHGLIRRFREENLTPIASQIITGDLSVGMATRCDILCTDSHRNGVIVEVKATKHTNNAWYEASVDNMRSPLNSVPYSARNRDLLQLLITVMLMERGKAKVKVDRYFLIRASANVTTIYQPEPWCLDEHLRDLLYDHLKGQWDAIVHAREVKRLAAENAKLQRETEKRKRAAARGRTSAGKTTTGRSRKKPRPTGRVTYFTPGIDL